MLSKFQLSHDGASAEIYLQGAHLARFRTQSGAEVLFLSAQSHFAPGKAIRGGVPLIFPWFGPNQEQPHLPAHGFARTMEWQIQQATENSLALSLESNEATRALWNHDFRLIYRVEIETETLRLQWEIHNTGDTPWEFEAAMHTYFRVADVRLITIDGLDGKTYLDKPQNAARLVQNGAVQISGETDRVYFEASGPITLRDGAQIIRISDRGGVKSTVVWNPWIEKSRALADLGDDEWPLFVCIESGVIADDRQSLEAGQCLEMAVEIGVENLIAKNGAPV